MLTKQFSHKLSTLRAVGASAMMVLATLMGVAAPATAQVEQPNVKVILDWVIQGTHAPIVVAAAKGYFKDEGLNVQIDAGTGSGAACTKVASDVYQFGLADVATMVRFSARNAEKMLMTPYVLFDDTPLSVVSRKAKAIVATSASPN